MNFNKTLIRLAFLFCLLSGLLSGTSQAQEPDGPVATGWGRIKTVAGAGLQRLTIDEPAPAIALPNPMPNVTRALLGTAAWPGQPLPFSFNNDATVATLHLPTGLPGPPVPVVLEIAEQSRQFPDGRIVFSALDATVEGKVARLESHPGNHRIGFWSNSDDSVRWKYKATRPGNYKVWLTWSVAGETGSAASEIEIAIGEQTLAHSLHGTGSWYDYQSVEVGNVRVAKAGDLTVTVKCKTLRGGAVMNLKALTLVPDCEGEPSVQSADGSILLHARDSTTHGSLLQWEPSEQKRTVGYWANENDFVTWDFTVTEGGTFDVEILQGCGQGQGGSKTMFAFHAWESEDPLAVIPHTVRDTGHWQAFEPVTIGQVELAPGKYRLRVSATDKAANAVMDLRQTELRPVR